MSAPADITEAVGRAVGRAYDLLDRHADDDDEAVAVELSIRFGGLRDQAAFSTAVVVHAVRLAGEDQGDSEHVLTRPPGGCLACATRPPTGTRT